MGGDSSGGRQDRGKGEVRAEDRGERRAGRAEEGKGSFGGGFQRAVAFDAADGVGGGGAASHQRLAATPD